MVQDNVKFTNYYNSLKLDVKKCFPTIDINEFEDYYHDAFIEKYLVFEKKFDSTKSLNEKGYLFKLVVNKINDLLNRKTFLVSLDEIEGDDVAIEPEGNIFTEFIIDMITKRSGLTIHDFEYEDKARKCYKMFVPLMRLQAWGEKNPLKDKTINVLSDKITSDFESEQFYDWREPTPIIRLNSWVGCS